MSVTILNPPGGFSQTLQQLTADEIVPRIFAADHTIWSSRPDEITNRLGWLRLPQTMPARIPSLREFATSLHGEGFAHVVLLGMGGSSLAPDTLARIFPPRPGALSLEVLDSTHPESVLRTARNARRVKTLFLVATKSGTTSETVSLFQYFYRALVSQGVSDPGRRFAAITDPGSPLAGEAARVGFRKTFLNPPDIGGRYSALSLFGLVPAALLGLDLETWLCTAQDVARTCSGDVPPQDNPALQLGCYLGAAALAGRDKATFLTSRTLAPFGDWIEQLIAESSGKDGTGILPVLELAGTRATRYSEDRALVLISHGGDSDLQSAADALVHAGHPVARVDVSDSTDLSGQFFLWEMATAIACHLLGVHPFDQPNVESAKRLAREAADVARRTGSVPTLTDRALDARGLIAGLADLSQGDYVGVHAYLPASNGFSNALHALQAAIRDRFGVAVTVGYGPRFLHSTGQLHKGDAGRGRFIQLVSPDMPSVPIPDGTDGTASSLSFAGLIVSQAHGDRRALAAAGRSVATFALPPPYAASLQAVVRDLLSLPG